MMPKEKTSSSGGPIIIMLVIIGALLVILGIAGVVWFALKYAGDFSPGSRVGYARLERPNDQDLWLQFETDRMRMAPTPEALEAASWIEFEYDEEIFEEISPPLEIPLGEEGGDFAQGLQARFRPCTGHLHLKWQILRRDAAGSQWLYVMESDTNVEPEETPQKAQRYSLPELQEPQIEVTTQADWGFNENTNTEGPRIGIAVELMWGEGLLEKMQKDGEELSASVRLLDDSGAVVEAALLPLSDLGFT